MTAKIVIASAARLIEVRHFCRSRNKIAEISVPAWPIPIQNTKLVISHAQATGIINPHTPTPVEIRYVTHTAPISMMKKLGMKASHHQRGVLPSATPAMWSEIQPIDRRLSTSGSRTNSAGGGATCGTAVAVAEGLAISAPLLSLHHFRFFHDRRPHLLQRIHGAVNRDTL